jgi:hypothetical protein
MKMAGKHLVAISEISHFPSTPVEITGKTTHFLSADRPWPHKFQVGISTTIFFLSLTSEILCEWVEKFRENSGRCILVSSSCRHITHITVIASLISTNSSINANRNA